MVRIGNLSLPERPVFLAPMEGVTDQAFRILCKKYGADMMYTEFISSEGLIRDADKSMRKLNISDIERPIGIQIFGNNVQSMCQAALIAQRYSPDVIDINCGCPVRKVVSHGCGAALLQDEDRLVNIVSEVVKTVNVPVTVKTRLGWDEYSINIESLILKLQDVGIKAIAVHTRTRNQMYSGNAQWNYLASIKNNSRIHIPIIGNGDVKTLNDAKCMFESCGVDGVMIGRGAMGNPWIFSEIKGYKHTTKSLDEILTVIREHLLMACDILGERHGVISLRKHYAGYFNGVHDSKTLKLKLQLSNTKEELLNILNSHMSRD